MKAISVLLILVGLPQLLFWTLLPEGIPLIFAAMASALLLMGLLTLVEGFENGFFAGWTRTDVHFLLGVQVAFTKSAEALGAVVVPWAMISLFGDGTSIWPSNWTVVAQVISMLVIGEFGRYWLHRAAHTIPWLWRIHAVHHSSGRLNWINTNRFHPLEKIMQMSCETFLFMALQIPPPLILSHYLLYASFGYMQHLNAKINFGWLNRIFSTNEQHRWHHSQIIVESNSNYGNKLSIFDQMFGTFYLPPGEPAAYGLQNPLYPGDSVLKMMRAPGQKNLDKSGHYEHGLPIFNSAINFLLGLKLRWVHFNLKTKIILSPSELARAQEETLLKILIAQRDTTFGQQHKFSQIRNVSQFQAQVPVQNYESLRSYFDRQDETGAKEILAEEPIFYSQTSGTTGLPKFIPITQESLASYRRLQTMWLAFIYHRSTRGFSGRFFGIAGAKQEGRRQSGKAFGSSSGHIYASLPKILKKKYVVPAEVFDLKDTSLKYLLLVRLALQEDQVSWLATANPSTLLQLEIFLNQERETLLQDLASGGFSRLAEMSPSLQKIISRKLIAHPSKARHLAGKNILTLKDLFPKIALLSTWQGGNCRMAFEKVKRQFDASTEFVELGYLSSEFRGAVPFQEGSPAGFPSVFENFFEFVEKSAYESGQYNFLTLDQLEIENQYYTFITTATGLYRYDMNDIVGVVSKFHGVPLIYFVQKGKGVTSLTGEKVSEYQVITSVQDTFSALGRPLPQFLVLADEATNSYKILLEDSMEDTLATQIATKIDFALGELNIEYKSKRDTLRLKPLEVLLVSEKMLPAYKDYLVRVRSQRESQLKLQTLQMRSEFGFDYLPYVQISSCDKEYVS